MTKYLKSFYWIILAVCPGWGCAQVAVSQYQTVEQFIEDPCFSSAGIGISVFDLSADSFIIDFGGTSALPPASTLKVLSSAAALKILGHDYRFRTEIGYSGEIKEGTLEGDLIIIGKGDPTLGSLQFTGKTDSTFLQHVKSILDRSGIRKVNGRIVGDASFYPASVIPRTWPYQDMGNYYGSFCAGLNYHDNLYFLSFQQPSKPGTPVTNFTISPEVPRLTIESLVRAGTAGSGDQAYIMGAPFQINRFVIGTIPAGSRYFTIKGSVPDPALFCANAVKSYLQSTEIFVTGESVSTYIPLHMDLKIMDTLWSPSLNEVIKITNQKSVNLFAEALGQYLSSVISLEDIGKDWLVSYWSEQGIDMSGAHFSDFSGLAPDNAISPQTMVKVLERMFDGPASQWDDFLASLAVAGVSGTMKSLLSQSRARGRIFAKSGLISGVRNYCGYIAGDDDQWYAFSVFTYNATCGGQQVRKKLEHLLETLYLSLIKDPSE
ncbi:MAG: D-alanyl-D-alanine carboxypeptidase/D-alanyl-D-alanine-endopeptidase [Saprospiraceae bacterium]|nr:D-alanyl-D-alanine carboxypeptidase/D-alanyl-D-alanine-endopeptidase [Saprospiraceae bacterium]